MGSSAQINRASLHGGHVCGWRCCHMWRILSSIDARSKSKEGSRPDFPGTTAGAQDSSSPPSLRHAAHIPAQFHSGFLVTHIPHQESRELACTDGIAEQRRRTRPCARWNTGCTDRSPISCDPRSKKRCAREPHTHGFRAARLQACFSQAVGPLGTTRLADAIVARGAGSSCGGAPVTPRTCGISWTAAPRG